MMAARNASVPQEDDFFELHLRRMLDAPSFIESPRNLGARVPATSMKSPWQMSEASTRSSDGRGHAEAFAESGYFSSGTAPPHSRSPPPPFSQPPYRSRDGGSVAPFGTSPRDYASVQVGLPPTSSPMPSRGSRSANYSRHASAELFREDRPGMREPAEVHYYGKMPRAPMHGGQQRQPQALVGRMQSEEAETLLANSICGFMQPVLEEGRSSSHPSSAPVPKAKPKKIAKQVPRCIQCGQAAGSSALDHVCPPCKAIVCAACVDDFRLIANSYRCPRCGDEKANQELLQSTAWRRAVARSARSLYRSASESWMKLLTTNSDADAVPSGCCSKNVPFKVEEICDGTISRATEPSRTLEPHIPRCVTKVPESAQPQHRTRLPVGWEEAMPRRAAGQRP